MLVSLIQKFSLLKQLISIFQKKTIHAVSSQEIEQNQTTISPEICMDLDDIASWGTKHYSSNQDSF